MSLVSPAAGSGCVAVVVVPLPQRLEHGVDARIYVVKTLSWWPCLIVERLSGVADAHSMEAQRNRSLDKDERSYLRPQLSRVYHCTTSMDSRHFMNLVVAAYERPLPEMPLRPATRRHGEGGRSASKYGMS